MPSYTTAGQPIWQWPHAIKPSDISQHLRANTSSFVSPYTRTTQTTELPGALHEVDAAFSPVSRGQLGGLIAFIRRLRGQAGRFIFSALRCRYQPPEIGEPERTTIIPLVASADTIHVDTELITADATTVQYESIFTATACPDAVTITGTLWLNSNQAPLQVGSPISWDDADGWRHLHTVVDMVHDLGTGAATLTVEPPMRFTPTPTTPMHVHAPSGIFRLADDGQGVLRQAGRLTTFTVSMVEAHPLKVTV